MRKPAIPQTPREGDKRERFDTALRETVEIITGRRGTASKVAPLASTATTADVIAKVNELLDVLQ